MGIIVSFRLGGVGVAIEGNWLDSVREAYREDKSMKSMESVTEAYRELVGLCDSFRGNYRGK